MLFYKLFFSIQMGWYIQYVSSKWNNIFPYTLSNISNITRFARTLRSFALGYDCYNENFLPKINSGKVALCQDERTIIVSGNGAGYFCPMPFFYNRIYFDTCTRKSSTSVQGLELFYWCPDPRATNNTPIANTFTMGSNIGQCTDFLIPQGKYFFVLERLAISITKSALNSYYVNSPNPNSQNPNMPNHNW